MAVSRASPRIAGLQCLKSNGVKWSVSWLCTLGALVVGFLMGDLNARGFSAGLGLGQTRARGGGAPAEEDYRFQIPSYSIPGPVEWSCLPEVVQNAFLMDGQVSQREQMLFVNKKWAAGDPVTRVHPRLSWWHGLVQDFLMKAHTKDYKKWTYGPQAAMDLVAAMEAHPVTGKSVLVVGSREPWVEALVMAAGARHVSTTAFNNHTLDRKYPWWTLIHEDDLDARRHKFDAIVAYAVVEHVGLGRYGDPINPDADLEQMRVLRNFMKPGGLLFLAVPIGTDAVWFNVHRVYGRNRWPLLIKGWEYLNIYQNYTFEKLLAQPISDQSVRPVIALKAN